MSLNRPFIDDLLAQIPSPYELAVAAAIRAQDIKRANREHIQPLQTSLQEIADGKITVILPIEEPSQGELKLEALASLPEAPPESGSQNGELTKKTIIPAIDAFPEPWHGVINRWIEHGLTIEPGGDVLSEEGRVVGSYVAKILGVPAAVYIIDQSQKTAGKTAERLTEASPEDRVCLATPSTAGDIDL